MIKGVPYMIGLLVVALVACQQDGFENREVEIPDFNFPKTVVFEDSLSAYNIFQGVPSELDPALGFELLELNSSLFSDYTYKQRLVQIPEGSQLVGSDDHSISFPNGTILVKTFYYYFDERDTTSGKDILETRLLIKERDEWNVATYVWNESQTEATLSTGGSSKQISWVNTSGVSRSTQYEIPTENQCMTCHQANASLTPLGPTLSNLNRSVLRNGVSVNQLSRLQEMDLLVGVSMSQVSSLVDYKDLGASIADRARAYLAVNCAHCHNPNAWDVPAAKAFDFRAETSLQRSGIPSGRDEISRNMVNQEMPFLGTTLLDEEGVALILEYLEGL